MGPIFFFTGSFTCTYFLITPKY